MHDKEIGLRIAELRRELDDLAASSAAGSNQPPSNTSRPQLRRRGIRRAVVFAVMAVALAVPGAVIANHQFSDVPNSNTFHNSISNIKIAGITGGCGGTKYCPSAGVTRGQMAAFLNRGLARGNVFLGFGTGLTGSYGTVVEGTILTPGAGYILANAASMAYTSDASTCPCNIRTILYNAADNHYSFFYETTMPTFAAGDRSAAISNTYVFPVDAGGAHTIALQMNETGTANLAADASLTLVWVPFDAGGYANGATSVQARPTQPKH